MDKRCSKIFLITVSITMVLLIITLGCFMKENIIMEDIWGNRSALGDMNVVYHRQRGSYETDKIIISKDKEEVQKYTKEGCSGFSISKENIENRELFQNISSKNEICEDENEMASVSIGNSYLSYSGDTNIAYISVKDKQTKEIKEYEIEIDDNVDLNSMYKVLPIKSGDNIYLAIISSVYNEESTGNDDIYKQTYLYLYKLNLPTKQSRCIISKFYDSKEINIDSEVGFVRGNVSYFTVNIKDKNSKSMKTCLFAFNVMTKDVDIINLGIDNKSITNYFINNNEVVLSCEMDDTYKNLEILTVNLDKHKVSNINKINLKSNNGNDKSIIEIKENKNKLFLVINDSNYEDNSNNNQITTDTHYYIYVINKANNENLYTGKITEKYIYNLDFGILKKEEF